MNKLQRIEQKNRHRVTLNCPEKNICQPRAESDRGMSAMLRKCSEKGVQPIQRLDPLYGDFSAITSFSDAQLAVQEAREAFYTLPAAVRLRFGNNPQALVDFVQNPENLPEAIELGLVEKKEEKAQQVVVPAAPGNTTGSNN